ncbi:unnamed protein product [Adineta ricciae]|uniref:DUF4371 domain-containing protein n=1 Tax=Adineta ricciae TaxID=249248 RepID=A0A815M590_ADIRI|nr:unnamed protein product [Adineta ricciae]
MKRLVVHQIKLQNHLYYHLYKYPSSLSIPSPLPLLVSCEILPPSSSQIPSSSLVPSPTSYALLLSSTECSSSISSTTECSFSISPSECSSFIPSPKQQTLSASLSPLALSPTTPAMIMEKSSIPSDISRSSAELPTQPKLSSYPTDKQNRSFRSIWYSTFPWLEYSVKENLVYCYYCRHFGSGFNLLNRQQSDAFIAGRVEIIKKNRQRLTKIASTVLLCSRQSIALRGHDENELSNNRGNFIEILKWSSTTDPLVKAILVDSANNASYLSPLIQNELINLMANQIRKKIVEKVDGHVFAFMADETRDCTEYEQLSIVLRCISNEPLKNSNTIDKNSIFNEYLLGLVKLNEFDAESLSMEIIKYLEAMCLIRTGG